MQRKQKTFDFSRGEQLAMIRDARIKTTTAPDGRRVSGTVLRCVLRAIDDHGRGRPAFPSVKQICTTTGCGRRNVLRALATLEQGLGLLVIQRRGSQGGRLSSRYTIVWSELAILAAPQGALRTPQGALRTPQGALRTPQGALSAQGNVQRNVQEAPSKRLDGDGDEDGGIFSEQDQEEIRRQANRLADLVPCTGRQDNRDLVAKVAFLWGQGLLSEDDLEQARESILRAKPPPDKPGGWLYSVLENRVGRGTWRRLLARCEVPDFLKRPTNGQEKTERGGNRAGDK